MYTTKCPLLLPRARIITPETKPQKQDVDLSLLHRLSKMKGKLSSFGCEDMFNVHPENIRTLELLSKFKSMFWSVGSQVSRLFYSLSENFEQDRIYKYELDRISPLSCKSVVNSFIIWRSLFWKQSINEGIEVILTSL